MRLSMGPNYSPRTTSSSETCCQRLLSICANEFTQTLGFCEVTSTPPLLPCFKRR